MRQWIGMIAVVAVSGCGSPPPAPVMRHPELHVQYVQTTGSSHWPHQPKGPVWVKGKKGTPEEALIVARGAILTIGLDVVERDQLSLLLKEQETQLAYGDERQADQVSVGKLLGAHVIMFVEMSSQAVGGDEGRRNVGVSIRVVGVETGTVYALSEARWTRPVSSSQELDVVMSRAVSRAFCPADRWDEASDANGWNGRCR